MNKSCAMVLGIFLFLLCSASIVLAEEGMSPAWNLVAGGKGVYGTGVSEANTYYAMYGEGSLDLEFLKLSFRGSRFLDYQLADGLGAYEYVNINEGAVRATINPWSCLSFGGDYKYASGDSSYERRDWSALLRLGPDDFYLEGEYGEGSTKYLLGTRDIEIQRADASLSVSRDLSDTVSMEIGYDRTMLEFSSLDYEYVKQTGRIGIVFDVAGSVFLMAGISGGGDSEEYTIGGGDAGAVAMICSHVKISAVYLFERYVAPSASSTTKKSGGGTSGASNPYLSPDRIGDSYSSHRISIGASIGLN